MGFVVVGFSLVFFFKDQPTAKPKNKKGKHTSNCDKNYGGLRSVRYYPNFLVDLCVGNHMPLRRASFALFLVL